MLWVTGGLGWKTFEKATFLVPTDDQVVLRFKYGPRLRQPRILHCSLTINSTHSFIHGGIAPKFQRRRYRPFYQYRSNKPGHRYNGYTSWTFDHIANKTAEQSYIYDWKRETWIKVSMCDLIVLQNIPTITFFFFRLIQSQNVVRTKSSITRRSVQCGPTQRQENPRSLSLILRKPSILHVQIYLILKH